MKKLILLVLAVASLPSCAWAQGVRIDPFPVSTIAGSLLPGNAYPAMLAIPGALVSVCNYPANGNPCTNFATTYTDGSLATACPNSAQVTLQNSSTCQNAADTAGNFGFWVSAGGNYTYNITLPGSGQTYGPYAFTAATAGCPITGCIFTGAISASVNGVLNVGLCGSGHAPSWCAGSDIGAWVNAAIAQLEVSGFPQGTVYIPAGTYTQTTDISIPGATANLQATFKLQFDRGAVINYTGSGEAITVQGSIYEGTATIIENPHIVGTSSGVAGIEVTHGYWTIIQNPVITGFSQPTGTATGYGGAALWFYGGGATVINPNLYSSENGVLLTSTSSYQPNAIHLIGGGIFSCVYGWYHPAAGTGLLYVGQANSIQNVVFEGSPSFTSHHIVDEASLNFLVLGNYFEESVYTAIDLGSTSEGTRSAIVEGNSISSTGAPSSIHLADVTLSVVEGNFDTGTFTVSVLQDLGSVLNTVQGESAYFNQIEASGGNPVTLKPAASAPDSLLVLDPTGSFNALDVDAPGNGTFHGGVAATVGNFSGAVTGGSFNGALLLPGATGTITGTALSVSCDSGTATVTGAVVGHPVAVSSTTGADVGGAFYLRASVTATNTVTVYVCGTGTPASLAYNVIVF